ncbi:MAG: WYL domain-containing protein [Actinomycetia bacterium]|nr:WYL domain-containing protein [Actinomycetes bacterium]
MGQLARLLALIPWLLQRPGASVADVAREFGISDEQLRADLELAFFCGLPGHLPDDLIDVSLEDDRIVITNADTIARPLRLAPDEAVALLVGLRALTELPAPTGPDVIDRVIAKLERAAGDAADAHRHVTVSIQGAGDSQDAVADALRDGRRLTLEYYVPARDEVTVRDVDPMRLLVVDGQSYLEAWCLLASDMRIFRLDRIQSATLLDAAVSPHPTASVREGIFDGDAAPWRVRLALSQRAEWLLDAYPSAVVSTDPDLVVELPVADLGWARQLVLRLGDAVRPLSPPELVDAVRDDAEAALASYDGS